MKTKYFRGLQDGIKSINQGFRQRLLQHTLKVIHADMQYYLIAEKILDSYIIIISLIKNIKKIQSRKKQTIISK